MQLFPAIDLKGNQAVRLTKGKMDSATVYSTTPWEVAQEFERLGAQWIHIVDLDGAFAGTPKNLEAIQAIRAHTNVKIQLGGGIRDEATIQSYLDLGISRVILGSIAVKDPDFVKKMAQKFPIVVGIDAIDGYVAVQGWGEVSNIKATTLAKEYAHAGVEAIICTDVGKDGTLSGVNVDFTLDIAKASGIDTIASGGVKGIDDIMALKDTQKVAGAIIGKAFYEGHLNLANAFKVTTK